MGRSRKSFGLFDANENEQSVFQAAEFTGDSLGGRVKGSSILGRLCLSQINAVQI